jgi:hypothetical protein
MLTGQLALLASAAFAGAAVYVSLVQQPARLELDDQALLKEWRPAYKRGTLMRAPLARAWPCRAAATGGVGWIAGGLLMLCNWPFTFIAIMSTNRSLMAIEIDAAGPRSRSLGERWGFLHAGRSALGVTCAYIPLGVHSAI